MQDLYQTIANSTLGKKLFAAVKLPIPLNLERFETSNTPFIRGNVLLGAAPNPLFLAPIATTLAASPANIQCFSDNLAAISPTLQAVNLKATGFTPSKNNITRFKGLIFDASGIQQSDQLIALFNFFKPTIGKLNSCSRILILAHDPEALKDPQAITAQRAIEGFVRSLAKETGRSGSTVQLLYGHPDSTDWLHTPLRFFLSAKSAYISGQVLHINKARNKPKQINWQYPLTNKCALVTGAAQGIGKVIAQTLAREGAQVFCLDQPKAKSKLNALAQEIAGHPLLIDLKAENAAEQLLEQLQQENKLIDILVHNAGITEDKTLAKMSDTTWKNVLQVNLIAPQTTTEALLKANLIRSGGRIICISSINGIAGNFGQCNYATSKAGLLGYIQSMTSMLQKKNITINAVAPGFIETKMTAAIPFPRREASRRLNSLNQGGLPIDVAEAVSFFAHPGAAGIKGQMLRVCGQSLVGA